MLVKPPDSSSDLVLPVARKLVLISVSPICGYTTSYRIGQVKAQRTVLGFKKRDEHSKRQS